MRSTPDHDAEVVALRGARSAVAPPDADELLARVGRGDRVAFAAFHDLIVSRVYGVIRSVLRDPARSEEVTQEVMLELWRTAPRYQPSMGRATTWSLTIAHRRAVDRVRSEQSSRDREQRHAESHPEVPVVDVSVTVEDRFDRARVRKALGELTAAQRESIELAFFAGHSHSEVAALLDLPLGTVKTRIRDGLIRLRDRLEVMA
jgi:RNA polymerase sigma-70 factor (ECF subfamily)